MSKIRTRAAVGAALAESHPIDRAVYRALEDQAAGVLPGDLTCFLHPHLGPGLIERALVRLKDRGLARSEGGVYRPAVKPSPSDPPATVSSCSIPGHFYG